MITRVVPRDQDGRSAVLLGRAELPLPDRRGPPRYLADKGIDLRRNLPSPTPTTSLPSRRRLPQTMRRHLHPDRQHGCRQHRGDRQRADPRRAFPPSAAKRASARGCGVATLSISYYDLGVTTGKMAAKILTGEAEHLRRCRSSTPTQRQKYNAAACDAARHHPAGRLCRPSKADFFHHARRTAGSILQSGEHRPLLDPAIGR